MKVRQISVFLENRQGRLAEVLQLLADEGVNIRALALADTPDFGILRLIVPDPSRAGKILAGADFTVDETPVIAAAMDDRPGGLAGVMRALEAAKLNVEYLYAFVGRSENQAAVIFRVEDTAAAEKVLAAAGIRTLGEKDLTAF